MTPSDLFLASFTHKGVLALGLLRRTPNTTNHNYYTRPAVMCSLHVLKLEVGTGVGTCLGKPS
jgi:hypothetical protein